MPLLLQLIGMASTNKYGLGFVFTAKDLTGPVFDRVRQGLAGIKKEAKEAVSSAKGVTQVTKAISTGTKATKAQVSDQKQLKKAVSSTAETVGVSSGKIISHYAKMMVASQALRVTTAASMAGIRAVLGAANISGQFTQELAAIQQITRSSKEDLSALKEEIYATGLATKFTPAEIAKATKSLSELGFTATQSADSIKTVALLASAGMIDIDQAGRAVVGTLNAFHMSADQAATVGDKLARITQISAFQARDFQAGLSRAAVVASGYGQSLDSLIATMGALRDANLKSNVASTGIREMMTRIYGAEKVQQQLKGIGIEVYDTITGQRRDMVTLMDELATATQAMTDKQKDNLLSPMLGKRGSQAFIAAISAQKEVMIDGTKTLLKGVDAIRYMSSETQKATGTLKKQNDAVMDTFEGQKKIFTGAWMTAVTKVGEAFEKLLKPFVKFANFTLGKFAKAWSSMTEGMQEGVAIVAALSVGAMGLTTALGSVVAAGYVLSGMLGTVGLSLLPVLGGVAAAVVAVGALVGGVVAVGAAAKFNIAGIGTWFKDMGQDALLVFDGLKQYFNKGFIEGDTAKSLMGDDKKGVLRFLQRIIEFSRRAKNFINGVVEGIESTFAKNFGVFEQVKETITAVGEAFGITTKNMKHLQSTNAGAKESGKAWGEILGDLAIGAVRVADALARAAVPVIKMVKVLGPPLLMIWGSIAAIVSQYPKTLLLATAAAYSFGKSGSLAQVAFAGLKWTLAAIRTVILTGIIPALSTTFAISAGITAPLWAILLVLGMVGAAAVAFGVAMDRAFDISGKLAKMFENNDVLRKFADGALSLVGMDYRVKGFDQLSDAEKGVEGATGPTKYVPNPGRFDTKQPAPTASQPGVSIKKPAATGNNDGTQVWKDAWAQLKKEASGNKQEQPKVINLNIGEETVAKIVEKGNRVSETQAPASSWSE